MDNKIPLAEAERLLAQAGYKCSTDAGRCEVVASFEPYAFKYGKHGLRLHKGDTVSEQAVKRLVGRGKALGLGGMLLSHAWLGRLVRLLERGGHRVHLGGGQYVEVELCRADGKRGEFWVTRYDYKDWRGIQIKYWGEQPISLSTEEAEVLNPLLDALARAKRLESNGRIAKALQELEA